MVYDKKNINIIYDINDFISQNFIFALAATNKDKNKTRTDICKENYKTLFKGEVLSTTGNDPDMMTILQKYIFGEVFTVGELDIKTRELITVTSLTVQQTLPQLKAHINAALNVGVTPIELRESIYQLAPFIGFPKTLNALDVLNEVFKERLIHLLNQLQQSKRMNVTKKVLKFKILYMGMK